MIVDSPYQKGAFEAFIAKFPPILIRADLPAFIDEKVFLGSVCHVKHDTLNGLGQAARFLHFFHA